MLDPPDPLKTSGNCSSPHDGDKAASSSSARGQVAGEADTDYVSEFMYSLANLRVAVEAEAFVGTLTSNWCMMVNSVMIMAG